MKTESKKIHTCHFKGCQAAFSRPYKLDFHIKKHYGVKFICSIEGCSKSYTSPSHLKRHISTSHEHAETNNDILCKICGLVFCNKYNFKKHLSKHSECQFPFNCTQCTKGFKKKRQLSEHMCIHSGEYPYKCEVCNTGFNKIHLLNKHKRNHKTYTCDCGETFSRWTIFCAHRKSSCEVKCIEHKCIICNKIFTTKSNLRMHSLIHVDESQRELFQCPYKNCKRSYKYKKNVNEHVRAFHEGTKKKLELNCTEPSCQTVLCSYVSLKRHLINIHNSKFRKKTSRRTRSDEGKPKKSIKSLLCGVESAQNDHCVVLKPVLEEQSSETDATNSTCLLEGNDQNFAEEKNMLTINASVDNILNNETFNKSEDVGLVLA